LFSYGESVDAALAQKYSLCKTVGQHQKALNSVQSALGLHVAVSVRELAIQHGCVQAAELARRVLQTFKEHMSSDNRAAAAAAAAAAASAAGSVSVSGGSVAVPVPAASIPTALLSTRSVYPCVAFYLSCKLLKLSGVDKRRLLADAQCTEREFAAVADAFKQLMPELEPAPAAAASPSKKRKKPPTADDTTAAAGDADAGATDDGIEDGDDLDAQAQAETATLLGRAPPSPAAMQAKPASQQQKANGGPAVAASLAAAAGSPQKDSPAEISPAKKRRGGGTGRANPAPAAAFCLPLPPATLNFSPQKPPQSAAGAADPAERTDEAAAAAAAPSRSTRSARK
jgi:hypothetical protein